MWWVRVPPLQPKVKGKKNAEVYITRAVKAAQKSKDRFRLGAVVLNGRKVISTGHNKRKTHAFFHSRYGHHHLHAECDALLKAHKGDTLVVVRLHKNGKLACSRPCDSCMDYIRDFGIKKVFFVNHKSEVVSIRL